MSGRAVEPVALEPPGATVFFAHDRANRMASEPNPNRVVRSEQTRALHFGRQRFGAVDREHQLVDGDRMCIERATGADTRFQEYRREAAFVAQPRDGVAQARIRAPDDGPAMRRERFHESGLLRRCLARDDRHAARSFREDRVARVEARASGKTPRQHDGLRQASLAKALPPPGGGAGRGRVEIVRQSWLGAQNGAGGHDHVRAGAGDGQREGIGVAPRCKRPDPEAVPSPVGRGPDGRHVDHTGVRMQRVPVERENSRFEGCGRGHGPESRGARARRNPGGYNRAIERTLMETCMSLTITYCGR